jgi:hypothetical protein
MEEAPKEGEPLKLNGSALMTYAASREEVLEQLKNDIYATSGVWDLSKVWPRVPPVRDHSNPLQVQIYPFKCAFRRELPLKQ